MRFEVEMISKDKHVYVLTLEVNSKEEIDSKVSEHIYSIEYDIFGYKIKNIKSLDDKKK